MQKPIPIELTGVIDAVKPGNFSKCWLVFLSATNLLRS